MKLVFATLKKTGNFFWSIVVLVIVNAEKTGKITLKMRDD